LPFSLASERLRPVIAEVPAAAAAAVASEVTRMLGTGFGVIMAEATAACTNSCLRERAGRSGCKFCIEAAGGVERSTREEEEVDEEEDAGVDAATEDNNSTDAGRAAPDAAACWLEEKGAVALFAAALACAVLLMRSSRRVCLSFAMARMASKSVARKNWRKCAGRTTRSTTLEERQ